MTGVRALPDESNEREVLGEKCRKHGVQVAKELFPVLFVLVPRGDGVGDDIAKDGFTADSAGVESRLGDVHGEKSARVIRHSHPVNRDVELEGIERLKK